MNNPAARAMHVKYVPVFFAMLVLCSLYPGWWLVQFKSTNNSKGSFMSNDLGVWFELTSLIRKNVGIDNSSLANTTIGLKTLAHNTYTSSLYAHAEFGSVANITLLSGNSSRQSNGSIRKTIGVNNTSLANTTIKLKTVSHNRYTSFLVTDLTLLSGNSSQCYSNSASFGINGTSTYAYDLCTWKDRDRSSAGFCTAVSLHGVASVGTFEFGKMEAGSYLVSLRQIWTHHHFPLLGWPRLPPCAHEFINDEVCVWNLKLWTKRSEEMLVGGVIPPNLEQLYTRWNVDSVYFIGDSTMKQVYDVARSRCSSASLEHVGRYHGDVGGFCAGAGKLEYVFCAGAVRMDLKLESVLSNRSIVIFNSGHSYIHMNGTDFRQLAISMRQVLLEKKFHQALFLASPAQMPANWDEINRCSHNNAIVVQTNAIMQDVLCSVARCASDHYYRSLSMSIHAQDGVHYDNTVYSMMLDEILIKLAAPAAAERHARADFFTTEIETR
jgi:hypothetical protein